MKRNLSFIKYSFITIMIFDLILSYLAIINNSQNYAIILMFIPLITTLIFKQIMKIKHKEKLKSKFLKNFIYSNLLILFIILVTFYLSKLAVVNNKIWTMNILTFIVNLIAGTVVSFGEEYGWRGSIWQVYIDNNSLYKGTIKTSIMWGVFHIPMVFALNYNILLNNLWLGISVIVIQFLATFFAGIWFNYFYYKTNKYGLLLVTLMHATWNLVNQRLNLSVYHTTNWNNVIFDGEGIVGTLIFILLTIIFYKKVLYMKVKDEK